MAMPAPIVGACGKGGDDDRGEDDEEEGAAPEAAAAAFMTLVASKPYTSMLPLR